MNYIHQHPWLTLTAILLPFIASLIAGPKLIAILRAMKAGQPIREARKGVLAPEHQSKTGTPTMGGIMLIGLVLITMMICCKWNDPMFHCCLLVTAVTAGLGFLDDFAKITKHSSDGVSGLVKIAIQAGAALACGIYLFCKSTLYTSVLIPFYGPVDFSYFFIPFAMLVIIGSSNAVNLTDGLDGLASGCVIIACLFLMLLTDSIDSMPILLAVISACAGFLYFNAHPAKVFMGDTGSLALGGLLGTIAVCSGLEFILMFVGGVFVLEACSVMIQVYYFKYTRKKYGEGRRFFRMAPIHHHFEKLGWTETQVCVRFWIAALVLGLLSLVILSQSF